MLNPKKQNWKKCGFLWDGSPLMFLSVLKFFGSLSGISSEVVRKIYRKPQYIYFVLYSYSTYFQNVSMSISKLQGLHMIFVSSENREFGTAGARRAAARQARWWVRWASGATATAATAGLLREMTMYFMYSLTLCNIHLPSRYVYVYVCNLYSHNFSEKYIYIIYTRYIL